MMIAETLLGTTLICCAGTALYLYRDHERSRPERKRRDDDARAAFRRELARALKATKGDDFDYLRLVEECRIDRRQADQAARELVGSLVRKVVEDGVITERERANVDVIGQRLLIPANEVDALLRSGAHSKYREAVVAALADGIVTDEEADGLERLRSSFGLSRADAFQATADLSADGYFELIRRTARAGGPDRDLDSHLRGYCRAFGADRGEFAGQLRGRLIDLHRELVAEIVQDGEVTAEAEHALAWLRREARLDRSAVAWDLERLERAKLLGEFRRGNLPVIRSSKLLEGGETCHYEAGCRFAYQTRTKHLWAQGELVVTAKRLIFVSATKSFDFSPSKIIDLQIYHGDGEGVEIKTNTSRGNGTYHVEDAELLEAVLFGIVRKHKFLLAQSYSSERSRHIPDDVKRAVWDRDGGRCVRCSATEYLEWDHDIPHSKGGSNGVNNVQLLCRKCNNEKRDRIG